MTGKIWCNECGEIGDGLVSCANCDAECCRDCFERNNNPVNVYSVYYCKCGEILCGKCRVIKCKVRMDGCTGCYRLAFPALLEDKERQLQDMQAEIDEQKDKNNELKEENNELKRKLEDLIG